MYKMKHEDQKCKNALNRSICASGCMYTSVFMLFLKLYVLYYDCMCYNIAIRKQRMVIKRCVS